MADYTLFQFVFFLIICLSVAEFSIQVVISELSNWIMGVLRLSTPYNKKLDSLCSVSFWRKLLKRMWIIAIPIIFLFNIHRFFSALLSCPWCTSFWLALFTNHFYLKLDIITSLLLAPVALVFVTILDILHTKNG